MYSMMGKGMKIRFVYMGFPHIFTCQDDVWLIFCDLNYMPNIALIEELKHMETVIL